MKPWQIPVTKRTSHRLSLEASYNLSSAHGRYRYGVPGTWNTGPIQDLYNLEKERHTIASFDQTHIVKGYILDELPFRKGKSLMADADVALNALVGDWTVNCGFRYNRGNPIASTNWYPGLNNVYSKLVSGRNFHSASFNGQIGSTYFNPACFTNPTYGGFGNGPTYNSNVRGLN